MHLKAQDADDIYWIGKDEAKWDSRKPDNSKQRGTNFSTHYPNSRDSTSKPDHSPYHDKPAHSDKEPDVKSEPEDPDFSNKLGKDGKLKGTEQERHIKEGLCLYCGKPGHVAADCNKAAAAKACTSKLKPTESTVSTN